jgi:hypothetical protein|tara:strand:- start:398 stop:730 length:333 start_codon:yes stop_codon:yes gene_type:complete
MTRLEIVLSAILTVSVILNVGLFIYARAVVVRLLAIAEELWDLQQMIDSFAEHLNQVYELEMFYGDQTLENLLNHAISFNEQLETFEHIYTLTEEEIDNIETETNASKEA